MEESKEDPSQAGNEDESQGVGEGSQSQSQTNNDESQGVSEGSQSQSQNFSSYDQGDGFSSRAFVEQLRQTWINERCCPELLFYEDEIVDRIKELIDEQQELIFEARENNQDELLTRLSQMELDRVQYMLTAYLRTRIQKIEKHVIYILTNQDMVSRLSDNERDFASKYLDIIERLFNFSFLDSIPDKFRGLTEAESSTNMIPEPALGSHVFIKVKEDVGLYQINENGDEVELNENDILAASYQPFKALLIEDKIDLI